MKVQVIVNPKAGMPRDRRRIADKVARLFPEESVEVTESRSGEHLTKLTRRAVARGVDLLVAAGGDGTIHAVGIELIGTETGLGILPLGSGNGFARGLGIGSTPAQAITTLRNGAFRDIDVGEVNGEPFFCVSGLGFDALVGKRFEDSKVRGMLDYVRIAATESFQYRPVEASLLLDDREIVTRAFLITIANTNEFGGGAVIAPGADPTDGVLEVVVVRGINALEMLFHSRRLFDGSIDSVANVETYQFRKMRIIRGSGGPIHVDGEPLLTGPVLDYRVLPQAIRVWVPQEGTK